MRKEKLNIFFCRKTDQRTSMVLFSRQKNILRPRECYNNVFRIMTEESPFIQSSGLKIAYGAKSLHLPGMDDRVFALHAFFYSPSEKAVVDPSMTFEGEFLPLSSRYIIAKTYDYSEYLAVVSRYRYADFFSNPILYKILEEMRDWAYQQGIYLLE